MQECPINGIIILGHCWPILGDLLSVIMEQAGGRSLPLNVPTEHKPIMELARLVRMVLRKPSL